MAEVAKRAIEQESLGGQDWIEQELTASTLPDARLEKRLRHLVEQLAKGVGRSIPWLIFYTIVAYSGRSGPVIPFDVGH